MVHPICAPARHPDVPPAGEDSRPHRETPAVRVATELDQLRDAYHTIVCVRELLTEMKRFCSGPCRINRNNVEPLVDFLHAEFQRRAQVAWATIASMQAPTN